MNKIVLKFVDDNQYKLNVAVKNFNLSANTGARINSYFSTSLNSLYDSVDAIEDNNIFDPNNFYIFPIFYFHEETDPQYEYWVSFLKYFAKNNYERLKNKNTCLCICDLFESSRNLVKVAEEIKFKYPEIKIWILTADKKLSSKIVKVIYNDVWISQFHPKTSVMPYKPKKLYINLTRVARYHRCVLADSLISNNLLKIGYNTWGDVYDAFEMYKQDHPKTKIAQAKFDVLDIEDLSKTNPNDVVPESHCKKSFLYLATETHVDSGYMFFSEKVYKPIGLGMPFITLGNPGTLEDLRQRGFFTFSEWFDESYDLDLPLQKRIDIICKNLITLSKYRADDLIKIRKEMKGILEYNQQLYALLQKKNSLKQTLRLAAEGIL
jgi:hypothetical protein